MTRPGKMQKLDSNTVALQVDRAKFHVVDPKQGAARFAREFEFVKLLEAQSVAIEAQRPLPIRHTDADVAEAEL
jgi:hypothetical protein